MKKLFSVLNRFFATPEVCTREKFEAILDDPRVAEVNRAAAAEPDHELRAKIKKQLPGFCFHATFTDGHRCNESAVASGLYMIDLDEICTEMTMPEYYQSLVRGRELELGIVLGHVTPSGRGLRMVGICPQGYDVQQSQLWLLDMLGVTEFDGVVKDFARFSYACSRGQLTYYDPERMFGECEGPDASAQSKGGLKIEDIEYQELNADGTEKVPAQSTELQVVKEVKHHDVLCYKGVPYGNIVDTVLLSLGIAGAPAQGERNSTLYTLTRLMRYLCDFNYELLMTILPSFGLSQIEKQNTVKSALGSVRSADVPQKLRDIVERLQKEQGLEFDRLAAATTNNFDCKKLPRLPKLLRLLVKAYPEEYQPAVLAAALAMLGTLATNIRGYYLDGQIQSLEFLVHICAPQASGKSFTRNLVDLLMEPINAEDAAGRAQERKYNEEKKANKNKSKQPEDPRAVIRNVPGTVSNAMLLKRADYAQGKHLFTFCEEIDTLVRGNKAGSWSAKSDILRQAFDNAQWGQDYMSDNSYSGMVNLYYNVLTCGTPNATHRFFHDVEDGLVSRYIFATLPDMMGTRMPKFGHLSKRELEEVRQEVKRLHNLSSGNPEDPTIVVHAPAVLKAIDDWEEERRLEYLRDQSNPALELLRRRAGVVGFRAGLLCCQLGSEKLAAEFAVWMANYTLHQQLCLFGEEMNRELEKNQQIREQYETKRLGHNVQLIDQLPVEFTLQDLIQARLGQGLTIEAATLRSVIFRWIKNGMLVKVAEGRWRKPDAV